jgi:hypothetical protein
MSRGDKITLVVLLLLIFFTLFLTKGLISPGGKRAVILLKGREVKKVSLGDEKKFKIMGSLGEMTLEVKKGKVRVLESKCPLKVCIERDWISSKGEEIICIPNEVRVKIEGENREFDEIVH